MTASNIAQVVAWLDQWMIAFDFTVPGIQAMLGEEIAWTIIRGPSVGQMGGIMGRCAVGETPDGTPWPPNSPGYSSAKQKVYGWQETNRRTNQMLSQVSLYGRTTIVADQVTLIYGIDSPPSTSAAPTGHLSVQDAATPDTVKAMHAHAQGRGFYDTTQQDADDVSQYVQGVLNDHIRATNQANGFP